MIEKKYDFCFVGAGLYNSVFAYLANKNGYSCLVIDKRNHIGGNCYTEKIEGINIHKYGPHIFHTSNKEVWKFVNQFVEFNNFRLSPVAKYTDENDYKFHLYNLPFNMNTFYQIFGAVSPEYANAMINAEKYKYKVDSPKNLEEQAINLVGKTIYEKLIKGYTEKQWHKDCKELPADIINRLPIRLTFDNNYFNDLYQGIPVNGYTELFENLLEGCDIMLDTDYFDNDKEICDKCKHVVYSGMIDKFFDYINGKLEYRDLKFELQTYDIANYQGVAVMNYTNKHIPYTRIIEHKHFETFNDDVYKNKKTVITLEYPQDYADYYTKHDPYYPINNDKNTILYNKYKEMGDKMTKFIFGGRLGKYKYFDMDDTIAEAMKDFNNFLQKDDA